MFTEVGLFVSIESEPIFRYHLNRSIGPLRNLWTYYNDIDLFSKSTHAKKIACFQIPYPWNNSIESSIDAIYDQVDTIIILGTELHSPIANFIKKYDKSKIRYFIAGFIKTPLLNARVYNILDWFQTTSYFYKNVRPSILHDLTPYKNKLLMFDALLGRKKPHREFAYNYIASNNIKDQGIVTYFGENTSEVFTNDHSNWLWEHDGLEADDAIHWTVQLVTYYGYRMSLSQVVPLAIYNKTAYSLVAETNFDNDYVFFTEKTVKPILGRRLFILLSHQHALKRLRDLGFKTFDGIIDESYDDIEATDQRFQSALDQLKWLCQQDQSTILPKLKSICDHNFDRMIGKDWHADMDPPIKRILLNQ